MEEAGLDPAGSSGVRKFLLACSWALIAVGLLGLNFVNSPIAGKAEAMAPKPPGAPVADPVTTAAQKLAVAPQVADRPLIAPAPPNLRGGLPIGKGMWIWLPEKADGGNVTTIVARAQQTGLSHIYVRTGSSKVGFTAAPFLNALLPAAHRAGIRVIGWDFPYLDDIAGDVARAVQAVRYVTPSGDRIDGFAADIELRSMGVNITPATGSWYGYSLRDAVGFGYPLIAVVPRPSPALKFYPYEDTTKMFDVIAPMIYWLNNDPTAVVNSTFDRLAPLGKPIMPIGQAYDGFAEGGPAGVPGRGSIHQFMSAVADRGGTGVSFWSWQHATAEVWQAVQDAALFQIPVGQQGGFRTDQVRAFQVLLNSLGFATPVTGAWGPETDVALRAFQSASHLPLTGIVDVMTREMLLRPIAPPLKH
jgi:hypothetical protein